MDKGKVDIQKRFGDRVRQLRLEANLSTRKFADTAGIALSQVWQIESGQGNPSLETIYLIAQVFNKTISELTEGI